MPCSDTSAFGSITFACLALPLCCSRAVQKTDCSKRLSSCQEKNLLCIFFGPVFIFLMEYLGEKIFRGHPYTLNVKWFPMQVLRWRKALNFYLSPVLVLSHRALELNFYSSPLLQFLWKLWSWTGPRLRECATTFSLLILTFRDFQGPFFSDFSGI